MANRYSALVKCPGQNCPCWVGIETGQTQATCSDCGSTARA